MHLSRLLWPLPSLDVAEDTYHLNVHLRAASGEHLREYAAEHGLTITALIDALAAFLGEGPPMLKRNERWVLECARKLDAERRRRS